MHVSAPTITALYAALNAMLNIALAYRVSHVRRRDGVSIGTGESQDLLIAVRTHANSAESVPLALLMMLIAELCGGASVPLHIYGGLLFVARIAHVIGMPRKAPNVYRVGSIATTWTAVVLISAYVLWLRTRS